MILKGVQIVKLCFIMIGLSLAIMSLQYPVIMASTLVVREMLPPEFTQIRNVRLFKTSIAREMSDFSLREAHIQLKALDKFHEHGMISPENESWIDVRFLMKTTNSQIQQRFEAVVDSCSLINASLTLKGVCFLSRPRFVYLQDCGDSNISIGETCDDGNTENWDGCNSACQVESNTTAVLWQRDQPVLCGAGLSNVKNLCDEWVCENCPAGKFKELSDTGIMDCAECEAGKYSESSSRESCYSQSAGSSSGETCVSCEAGKYSESTGASSGESCVSCGAGRIKHHSCALAQH